MNNKYIFNILKKYIFLYNYISNNFKLIIDNKQY